MKNLLKLSPEVAEALKNNRPVVALESTIISHGMPYPQNVETALNVEKILRDAGCVPATIAVIEGVPTVGCNQQEIDRLGRGGTKVTKVSRRDLPFVVAKKQDGATTVAATMYLASLAGIDVFATGGIGGVHRGAEKTMDISADLDELQQTSVLVVCAGAKSILDIGLTLECLETRGVAVVGYKTEYMPAFYTQKSGFKVDYRLDTPEEIAKAFFAKCQLGLQGGHACYQPHSRRIFHGLRLHFAKHFFRFAGSGKVGHTRQAVYPLPFGQNTETHRRTKPRRQHSVGVQQRSVGGRNCKMSVCAEK